MQNKWRKRVGVDPPGDGVTRRPPVLKTGTITGPHALPEACSSYFGWGTILRYGLGVFHPPGYFCCASSFETEGRMMTSSPAFQFTGVATLCFAVSCMESSTRSISSKLRPVLMG